MITVRRTDACSYGSVISAEYTGTECSLREHFPPTAATWIILQAINSQPQAEISTGIANILENNSVT